MRGERGGVERKKVEGSGEQRTRRREREEESRIEICSHYPYRFPYPQMLSPRPSANETIRTGTSTKEEMTQRG